MSDMAKEARAAMKAKAKRLTTADPHQKVDSSTWSPPEPLNTDVKTGMRPISRRAFKSGGKVEGASAKGNMGKATRSGNKPTTPDSMANKNMKSANEDRDGIKHVGALKDGGRAKKMGGGGLNPRAMMAAKRGTPAGVNPAMARSPGRPDPRMLAAMKAQAAQAMAAPAERTAAGGADMPPMKKGGRAKKYMGGPMMQPGGLMMPLAGALGNGGGGNANPMPVAGGSSNLPNQDKDTLYGGRIGGNPMKKGGKVHEDVAEDKALIKKMVKPAARTKKEIGGAMSMFSPLAMGLNALRDNDDDDDKKKNGGRTGRASGGGIFSGPGYPGKVPGVVPGGRDAHARGGKAGKTTVNIIIGKRELGMDDVDPMGGPTSPPPGMGNPRGAMPVAMPMPPGGAPMAAPAPMPMPYPVPMAGMGGGAPMPRKSGGRTYRSYQDMDAGAGTGRGRLEKTEIQSRKG